MRVRFFYSAHPTSFSFFQSHGLYFGGIRSWSRFWGDFLCGDEGTCFDLKNCLGNLIWICWKKTRYFYFYLTLIFSQNTYPQKFNPAPLLVEKNAKRWKTRWKIPQFADHKRAKFNRTTLNRDYARSSARKSGVTRGKNWLSFKTPGRWWTLWEMRREPPWMEIPVPCFP